MTTLALADVKVNGRHRKDLGDLESLIESIATKGLLHPIVVNTDGYLIVGQRRLEACRSLGWTEITVNVAAHLDDARAALEAERDENTCRLDMGLAEKLALGKALEELERPRAAARKGARTDLQPEEKFSLGENGKVDDLVGETLGMSGVTYFRARYVQDAAADETLDENLHDKVKEAADAMLRTGKVAPAYERVKHLREKAAETHGATVLNKRQQQYLEAAARRIGKGLYTLDGTCMGLREADVAKAVAGATAEQLDEWDAITDRAIKSLRAFRKRITEENA